MASTIEGVSVGCKQGEFRVALSGRFELENAAEVWSGLNSELHKQTFHSISVDATQVSYCDGAGISVLLNLKHLAQRSEVQFSLIGLSEEFAKLLDLYDFSEEPSAMRVSGVRSSIENLGKGAEHFFLDLVAQVTFIGELSFMLLKSMFKPSSIRFFDVVNIAEAAGVKALPITLLLGVLVGLIMAFQGAVLMAQFGAEIYIADFVGLSVTRELGPLITAIIVAGRTGSAFAAELGTMKVNEEIDAFTTMGFDPIRFLVVPRILAAMFVTPLLALFANVAGMLGGAFVMVGMGFPLITYTNRLQSAVSAVDLLSGLCKAFVFGVLIAVSGCLCGLRTGEGASAVGNSATQAVVRSIILIVLADGLFAVVFYYLGI